MMHFYIVMRFRCSHLLESYRQCVFIIKYSKQLINDRILKKYLFLKINYFLVFNR